MKSSHPKPPSPKRIQLPVWFLPAMGFILSVPLYLNLEAFSRFLTYTWLGLKTGQGLAIAVEFFVYECPKVFLFLVLIVFVMGIFRSFFPPSRIRKLFEGKKPGIGHLLGTLLGVLTPFCSCSAIPLFIGFVTAGVPLGITFSFLVAAPMVNEVALALLFGMLGWKVTLLYMTTGLALAILTGLVIDLLPMENQMEPWVYKLRAAETMSEKRLSWFERIQEGKKSVREIISQIWIYVVVGILAGSLIQGFIPQDFMASLMGKSAWWSVPASVLLGLPMYANSAGIIPLVKALLSKGAALGTVLSFMMSITGLSLPEFIILRKVLKPRLIGVFFAVVALGILLAGYLMNWLI